MQDDMKERNDLGLRIVTRQRDIRGGGGISVPLGAARSTIIPDQRVVRAKAYPYSSIVGTGVMLHNAGGAVIGQLTLLNVSGGRDEAVAMATQVEELLRYGLAKRAELAAELERGAAAQVMPGTSNEQRVRGEAKRQHEYLAGPLGPPFAALARAPVEPWLAGFVIAVCVGAVLGFVLA